MKKQEWNSSDDLQIGFERSGSLDGLQDRNYIARGRANGLQTRDQLLDAGAFAEFDVAGGSIGGADPGLGHDFGLVASEDWAARPHTPS